MPRQKQDLAERFWSKVAIIDDEDSCWLWQARIGTHGYGEFKLNGKKETSHRVAYELTNGEIEGTYDVCHQCDNRMCCRPKHLDLGNRMYNMQDMVDKGRNHANKLTHEQVIEVKLYYKLGMTKSDIARAAGLNYDQVRNICAERWHQKTSA